MFRNDSVIVTHYKEPPHMTWSEGAEEITKLVLAGMIGALGQYIRLSARMQRLDILERDVAELKTKIPEAATKADLAREVASLQTIMELKLGTLGSNMQTLTGLVQRALDRPTKP